MKYDIEKHVFVEIKYQNQFSKLSFLSRKNVLNKNTDVTLCYKKCNTQKCKKLSPNSIYFFKY